MEENASNSLRADSYNNPNEAPSHRMWKTTIEKIQNCHFTKPQKILS